MRGSRTIAAFERTVWFGVVIIVSIGCIADDGAAQVKAKSDSATRYDGLTVEQWRARLKNLDPTAPQSAKAVPGLIALIRDQQVPDTTRGQAAQMLGRIGKPARDAVPVLNELLDEPERPGSTTFFWSAKALGLFRAEAKEAAPKLIQVLQDGSRSTAKREAAMEALTYIGAAHPRVVATFVEVLQKPPGSDASRDSDNASLRANAALSLGIIGSGAATAVPALSRATRDRFESVRRNAVAALGHMGGQAEVAIPSLADALLTDESAAVRDEAAIALSKVGPRAIPALEQLLQDDDPQVKRRAVDSLGRMGPAAKSTRNVLIKLLDNENADVQLTAAESIWSITGEADAIIPTLVKSLADGDRQIQVRASKQLVAMGPKARPAVDSIKTLVADKRSQVRRIASETLKKIESKR